jgi:CysZ protein
VAKPLPEPCPWCGYPLVPFDPDTGAAAHCDRCVGATASAGRAAASAPGPGFFVADFLDGFLSLFRAALQLISRREYRGKLAVAVFVNLVLVVVFFFGLVWGFHAWIGSVDWSWGWVESAIQILSWPLALVAAWFLSPALIGAGMAPFLDPIAFATEKIVGGEQLRPSEVGLVRGIMGGLNAAVQVLILQIFILIPVLLLALIPVVGWIFVLFGVLFSAYLNALAWFEIPVLRRGYGWRYRRQMVGRNWARALGFGLAFQLGLLMPIFNILFIAPATAVAVSSLYFRFEKRTRGAAIEASSAVA